MDLATLGSSALPSATAKVASISAMIFFHIMSLLVTISRSTVTHEIRLNIDVTSIISPYKT